MGLHNADITHPYLPRSGTAQDNDPRTPSKPCPRPSTVIPLTITTADSGAMIYLPLRIGSHLSSLIRRSGNTPPPLSAQTTLQVPRRDD